MLLKMGLSTKFPIRIYVGLEHFFFFANFLLVSAPVLVYVAAFSTLGKQVVSRMLTAQQTVV